MVVSPLPASAFWLAARQPDADHYVFNSQKSTQLNRITVFKLFRDTEGIRALQHHQHGRGVLQNVGMLERLTEASLAGDIDQQLGHRSFDSTLAYVNPSDSEASAAAARAFNAAF